MYPEQWEKCKANLIFICRVNKFYCWISHNSTSPIRTTIAEALSINLWIA